MNLEDAIISTISEIQSIPTEPALDEDIIPSLPTNILSKAKKSDSSFAAMQEPLVKKSEIIEDKFLTDLRERILVLFEGFQSPNNNNIEAKVDLTLNFLEHLLAQIDKKIENN